jgi:hypothetical protein
MRVHSELLEVTTGLDEGERVVSQSLEVDDSAVDNATHEPENGVAAVDRATPLVGLSRPTKNQRSRRAVRS